MYSLTVKIIRYLLELVEKLFKNEVASLRIVNLCSVFIKYYIHLSGSVNNKTS